MFIHLRHPCSKLQALVLQQQTFLEKCETWMEFLVQTEESLAVEISGNYPSLVEQQKAHEVFVRCSAAFTALSDWLTFSAKLI